MHWNLDGRDKKPHLFEDAQQFGDISEVSLDNFEILLSGYSNNRFKGRLAEMLHIKHTKPILNVQEQSVPLKLLNWSY